MTAAYDMNQTLSISSAVQADPWQEAFKDFPEGEGAPPWLRPLRKAGLAYFGDKGFPTTKDEDWRFTNVKPIAELPFQPARGETDSMLGNLADVAHPFAGLPGLKLVFVDGCFAPSLSDEIAYEHGVEIGNLKACLRRESRYLESQLTRQSSRHETAFSALNAAYFTDGLFLRVLPNRHAEKTVHCLFVSTGRETGLSTHPRNLIAVEDQADATVTETYLGLGSEPGLTNSATEVVLGENASLELLQLQDEPCSAYHVGSLFAQLSKESRFRFHSIAVGARLSRNNLRIQLAGEGSQCVLNGLYLTHDRQLADHHMVVEHAQPNTTSHEYFNGILNDQSKGVFHGRILVQQTAQKTDAKQTNKNLLLSEDATVDTKPQLEIYADDVRCTHGATIGQLDPEAIFYLRTRGIPIPVCRQMLLHAFAGEIMDRIDKEDVHDQVDKLVWHRLEKLSAARLAA